MELWIFLAGVILGSIVTNIIFFRRMVGTLRIDRSDPDDQPYMFAELSKDVQYIGNKSYVLMKVSTENYISPK